MHRSITFILGSLISSRKSIRMHWIHTKPAWRIIPETNVGLKSDFYGQIGDIYYQIKNMPEAYKAYDEALKYNDKNVVVLNNYAYFLSLEKKDLKKAERMSAIGSQTGTEQFDISRYV